MISRQPRGPVPAGDQLSVIPTKEKVRAFDKNANVFICYFSLQPATPIAACTGSLASQITIFTAPVTFELLVSRKLPINQRY
jgi:hypothetical protein